MRASSSSSSAMSHRWPAESAILVAGLIIAALVYKVWTQGCAWDSPIVQRNAVREFGLMRQRENSIGAFLSAYHDYLTY
jgi:hypothetical protein